MKKKWSTKWGSKKVLHGQRGVRIDKVGSVRQRSYCSRSLGIARKFSSARKPCSRNYLSRRRWKCKLEDIEK